MGPAPDDDTSRKRGGLALAANQLGLRPQAPPRFRDASSSGAGPILVTTTEGGRRGAVAPGAAGEKAQNDLIRIILRLMNTRVSMTKFAE